MDNILKNTPKNNLSNSAYAIILANKGENKEAEQKMELALTNSEDLIHIHHVYYQLGVSSAIMNNKEVAIEWLNKAADTGFPNYPRFLSDPFLENLKGFTEGDTCVYVEKKI